MWRLKQCLFWARVEIILFSQYWLAKNCFHVITCQSTLLFPPLVSTSTGGQWPSKIKLLKTHILKTNECPKYKIFNILLSSIYREYLEYTGLDIVSDVWQIASCSHYQCERIIDVPIRLCMVRSFLLYSYCTMM